MPNPLPVASLRFFGQLLSLLWRRLRTPADRLALLNFLLADHRPALPAPTETSVPAPAPSPPPPPTLPLSRTMTVFGQPFGRAGDPQVAIFEVLQADDGPLKEVLAHLRELLAGELARSFGERRGLKAKVSVTFEVRKEQSPVASQARFAPLTQIRIELAEGTESVPGERPTAEA